MRDVTSQGNLVSTATLRRMAKTMRAVETKLLPAAFGPSQYRGGEGGGGGFVRGIIQTVGAMNLTAKLADADWAAYGDTFDVRIFAGTSDGTGTTITPDMTIVRPKPVAGGKIRLIRCNGDWWNFDLFFETC